MRIWTPTRRGLLDRHLECHRRHAPAGVGVGRARCEERTAQRAILFWWSRLSSSKCLTVRVQPPRGFGVSAFATRPTAMRVWPPICTRLAWSAATRCWAGFSLQYVASAIANYVLPLVHSILKQQVDVKGLICQLGNRQNLFAIPFSNLSLIII
jgi:hypothetical protein